MSSDPSLPASSRSVLLQRVTIGLSVATILGSVLLRAFTFPVGIVCLVLGVMSFRAASREDPTVQGPAKGAVAVGVMAFLIGLGWIIITALMSTPVPGS